MDNGDKWLNKVYTCLNSLLRIEELELSCLINTMNILGTKLKMKKLDWILLIDDDEIDRFINEKIIRQCDVIFPVHTATDAYLALEWIEEKAKAILSNNESGLILLDINMPGMTGFEFLEAYNEKYSQLKNNVQVITLSSSNHRSDRQHMLELGASAYYSKPLNHEDFRTILAV